MAKKRAVPVTERAVIQRVNRKLAEKHGKIPSSPPTARVVLKKTRGWNAVQNLGEFYTLDVYSNTVLDTHVDLEAEARELGALADWETLVPNDDQGKI